MSYVFSSDETALMSRALQQALGRLKALGLVNGDAAEASSALSRLMLGAVQAGEHNEENLILFAIGRYHEQVADGPKPGMAE
jgi:hypothetical protein